MTVDPTKKRTTELDVSASTSSYWAAIDSVLMQAMTAAINQYELENPGLPRFVFHLFIFCSC